MSKHSFYLFRRPFYCCQSCYFRFTADSLTFRTDTIECQLTDAKGHFDGTGLNDLYQKRFPLPDVILQPHTAPLVKIAPFLKDQQLEGITDIGIRLVPTRDDKR